ncbi:DUF2756 family protein [Superficieibacter sp. 1612_C1]|jgi:hypothetical protein|uniref:DUF2756 family protein n=1 Tax=unclassified Superficieibacter TaxID=2645744 RepID=UPI0015A2CBC2|nr:DUF2756 family protein [Superficieibacter sp. 1612_C1]MDU2939539.1 DUF2756 family protein [Enterobacteriaceae bacterium]
MKRLLLLSLFVPAVVLAQPLNTMNNPNQPGYQIPSQQRMQTQMQNQQIQQKGMLNQQLQTQTRMQQQHLQTQMNNNSERLLQNQPHEQVLPNTNGGMLSSGQQHMLTEKKNGDMLNNTVTPSSSVR